MKTFTLQMHNYRREYIIASHKFYVEQAKNKLLSQFDNIEEEAESYQKSWENEKSKNFDPDHDDEGSVCDDARDEGLIFYDNLLQMKNHTFCSVVVGMYHLWEKYLRTWLHDQSANFQKYDNFNNQIQFFKKFNWDIESKPYYKSLNRCRHVCNAYKHGKGSSFTKIKTDHKDLLGDFSHDIYLESDISWLKITSDHIDEFAKAIEDFWKDFPCLLKDTNLVAVNKFLPPVKNQKKNNKAQNNTAQTKGTI